MSDGYVHWICFDDPVEIGCGTVEPMATGTTSIATVTCPRCQAEISNRLRDVTSGAGDRRWLEVDWSDSRSVQTWVEGLWETNWRLHAEVKELREKLETLTKQKVEWLSGRLTQADIKAHEEEQYAQPDPECAGCKRWTQRIKVLEERVEYARKVLEGR